jgi:SM-20-related protein
VKTCQVLSIQQESMTNKESKILDELSEKSWSACPDFFNRKFTLALMDESKNQLQEGLFHAAAIGKLSGQRVKEDVRGDNILWFDENKLTDLQTEFMSGMTDFQDILNSEFHLGINEMEFHFAVYPIDSFYKKHLDQFKDKGNSNRVISCILYLNDQWLESDGGQLRIHSRDKFTDVFPDGGKFVCFRSEEVQHEVMPTKKDRHSVTGWMKN